MKRILCALLVFSIVFAFAACEMSKTEQPVERQIVSARLDQAGNDIDITLDISGGWSAEFAPGAFYLYDKPYTEEKAAIAIGMTLEQEVFEEYQEDAKRSANRRDINGVQYYKAEDGRDTYLMPVGEDAYLMLRVEYATQETNSDAILARVTAERGTNKVYSVWSREGYFEDGNGNAVSVTNMSDTDTPDWYVGCLFGEDYMEDSWGGTVTQAADTLQGSLPSASDKADISVVIREGEDDDLVLSVEDGNEYVFHPVELPEATIIVNIYTSGRGMIADGEGDETPEIDPEWPYQSAYIGLDEPATYTFAAAPEEGSSFVKWTKNGKDFATEPIITLNLDESAEYIAVFEDSVS